MLSEREKNELKDLAKSSKLKTDLGVLSKTRYNPFVISGKVDADKFLVFLVEYNNFINHAPKSWRKIKDNDMRL